MSSFFHYPWKGGNNEESNQDKKRRMEVEKHQMQLRQQRQQRQQRKERQEMLQRQQRQQRLQMQKQLKAKKESQLEATVSVKVFQDMVGDIVDNICDFSQMVENKNFCGPEIIRLTNQSLVQTMNNFSVQIAELLREQNMTAIIIGEEQLKSDIQSKLSDVEQEAMEPFIRFMFCEFAKAKTCKNYERKKKASDLLPTLKQNKNKNKKKPKSMFNNNNNNNNNNTVDDNWNEKSVNEALSVYMGASCTVDGNVRKYTAQWKQLQEQQREMEAQIKAQNKSQKNKAQKKKKNRTQLQMPSAEELYQYSTNVSAKPLQFLRRENTPDVNHTSIGAADAAMIEGFVDGDNDDNNDKRANHKKPRECGSNYNYNNNNKSGTYANPCAGKCPSSYWENHQQQQQAMEVENKENSNGYGNESNDIPTHISMGSEFAAMIEGDTDGNGNGSGSGSGSKTHHPPQTWQQNKKQPKFNTNYYNTNTNTNTGGGANAGHQNTVEQWGKQKQKKKQYQHQYQYGNGSKKTQY